MVKILVTGATGAQGGAVIQSLLAAEQPITLYALTRSPDSPKAKKLASQGVQIVKGDLSDSASLTSALEDIQRAFLVTTFDGKRGTQGETETGQAFVKAAKEAGVEYVVFTSVEGSSRNSDVPHFDSKFLVEKSLIASGMGYSILRPVAFMDNFPVQGGFPRFMILGLFKAAIGANTKLKMVSVKDIGHFGAQALLKPEEYNRKELALAGDDLTVSEMCAAYGKVQYGGKASAWAAWIPRFFVNMILPHDVKKMFQFFRERGYEVDIPALKEMYPGLHSFEEYLKSKAK